jgi:hypothetical protein
LLHEVLMPEPAGYLASGRPEHLLLRCFNEVHSLTIRTRGSNQMMEAGLLS